MPEDKNNNPDCQDTENVQEKPESMEEALRETHRLLKEVVKENELLRAELQGVKEANLRLAKSMPAKPKQTFETAIADMFDLKKGR